MLDPVSALLICGLIVASLVIILWPRRGVAARLVRIARLTHLARIEDALKRIQDAEYTGRSRRPESLAGILQMRRARTMQLVARLDELGLVRTEEDRLALTDVGRGVAPDLRCLRQPSAPEKGTRRPRETDEGQRSLSRPREKGGSVRSRSRSRLQSGNDG
jgi:hypothetical protein